MTQRFLGLTILLILQFFIPSAFHFGQLSETQSSSPFSDAMVPPLDRERGSLHLDYSRSWVTQSQSPVTGLQRIVVILVEFPDTASTVSRDSIETQVFSRMNTYYKEVSLNSIEIAGSCFGWYRLGYPVAHYGADAKVRDDPNNDGRTDSWWLIRDAVEMADPYIDFRQYDHVMVVHAGAGQEGDKKRTDLIWSIHYSDLQIATNDGITIKSASITPEYQIDGDALGSDCHEFGHELGLPDLYDYDSDTDFVGRWCLMGSGCWNGQPRGSCPAHPMAWCKARLGWLSGRGTHTVYSSESASIEPLEAASGAFQALKIPVTDGTYYLLEVRAKRGFDSWLSSEGVVICMIDESKHSGEGIVTVIDAEPSTTTLDDAAWTYGRTFRDLKNGISIAIESFVGPSYKVRIERPSIRFYFTFKSQYYVWVRIDNNNYSVGPNELFKLQLSAKTYVIEIQPFLLMGPGSRTSFKQWGDGETSNPRTIDVFQDTVMNVVYATQYFLEVRSMYGHTDGTGWHNAGSFAQFSVSSTRVNEGALQYEFDRWEGSTTTTAPMSTILMDGPKVVTAVWRTTLPVAAILVVVTVVASCVTIPLLVVARRARPSRAIQIHRTRTRDIPRATATHFASCPKCNLLLRWVPERRRWYCYKCRRYT